MSNLVIESNGYYTVDPADLERKYTETDIPIEVEEELKSEAEEVI